MIHHKWLCYLGVSLVSLIASNTMTVVERCFHCRLLFLCPGVLGSGKQFSPWIHVEDVAGIYAHAIECDHVTGVLNGVAPEVATNERFTRLFAGALWRPAIFPVPAFALNLVFGADRAKLMLEGQHVIPKRTLDLGYKFKFPDLQSALNDIVNWDVRACVHLTSIKRCSRLMASDLCTCSITGKPRLIVKAAGGDNFPYAICDTCSILSSVQEVLWHAIWVRDPPVKYPSPNQLYYSKMTTNNIWDTG